MNIIKIIKGLVVAAIISAFSLAAYAADSKNQLEFQCTIGQAKLLWLM